MNQKLENKMEQMMIILIFSVQLTKLLYSKYILFRVK